MEESLEGGATALIVAAYKAPPHCICGSVAGLIMCMFRDTGHQVGDPRPFGLLFPRPSLWPGDTSREDRV